MVMIFDHAITVVNGGKIKPKIELLLGIVR